MSIGPQHQRRPASRIDPQLVFGISLLLALAVSWPALSGAMHGRVDIVQAGVHLLGALALSWAGCYGVGALLHGYAQSASAARPEPATATSAPQRRSIDAAPDPVTAGAVAEIEAGEAGANAA